MMISTTILSQNRIKSRVLANGIAVRTAEKAKRRRNDRLILLECDMNIYQPVCDTKNMETYQNPCLLGCKKILKGEYADCLCLPDNSTVTVGQYLFPSNSFPLFNDL